jgi:hypothetical protein
MHLNPFERSASVFRGFWVLSLVLGLSAAPTLVACDDDDDLDLDDDVDEDIDEAIEEGDLDGGPVAATSFRVTLRPLNTAAVGGDAVNGEASFEIDDGDLVAAVEAENLFPDIVHPQHVHAASRCPDASADTNGDGFIDVMEGAPAYGPILIPLDSDLSSQAAGDFPMADEDGELEYEESADLNTLLGDLLSADPNPEDPIAKLAPGEDLALGTRTVVLHGIDPSFALPETVASFGDTPANVTLPVACGEIVPIED